MLGTPKNGSAQPSQLVIVQSNLLEKKLLPKPLVGLVSARAVMHTTVTVDPPGQPHVQSAQKLLARVI
jgi:hypothetical protein